MILGFVGFVCFVFVFLFVSVWLLCLVGDAVGCSIVGDFGGCGV